MQTKKKRLVKILEIIQEKNIETQEELAGALRAAGYEVTQATVSRDIRELRLQKSRTADGRQKYTALLEDQDSAEMEGRFIRVMRDGVISLEQAQNILVIKTVPGMAMAVAAALDSMKFREIVGCIAGDDTIMAAVRSTEDAGNLMDRIKEMLNR
jgi:transcriptional regulator of arginine metabolism